MKSSNYVLLLCQFLIILFLCYLIIMLLRTIRILKHEKRILKYTVDGIKDDNLSLFDRLGLTYSKFRGRISDNLRKTHIFDNYSKKYIPFVKKMEYGMKDEMDFISTKVIVGFALIIVIIISDVLRYQSITLYQLLLGFLIGFFIPDIFLASDNRLRKFQIENELLKAVTIMNNAFKSGKSIMQAIEIVSDELDGPLSEEFRKMYLDLNYGLELDVVFDRFAERVNTEEARYMTTSLTILNNTGGNILKVFSSIEKNFFSRRKLNQEKKSLTATANFMFKSLAITPIIIFLGIFILNPDYFTPFFTSVIGLFFLGIIIILYVLYIFIVRKVMKVEGI